MTQPEAAAATELPWLQRSYHWLRQLRDGLLIAPTALLSKLRVPPLVVSLLGVVFALSTIWTLKSAPQLALAGLAAALICDALDGAVARRSGCSSSLGKLLDQVCDTATFCALLAAAVTAGLADPGPALYGGFLAGALVIAGIARHSEVSGKPWLQEPIAGFGAHFPKIFFLAALCLYLTVGQDWIAPAVRTGNLAGSGALLVLLDRFFRPNRVRRVDAESRG